MSSTIKKVSRGIGMLKYSKRYLPKENLMMLYRSLVGPYFRYCCCVWGSCGASALDKLQKLPNRAARIVMNSPYDTSVPPLTRILAGSLLENWSILRLLNFKINSQFDRASKISHIPSFTLISHVSCRFYLGLFKICGRLLLKMNFFYLLEWISFF